ncbi:unnamed protein product [Staurois parvus]|uniref:Uncharacterized protein n=1 Tax=Staurois parvus TaxID=386267 RepID=A0ABN9APL9_9NEOB|nr:unnamed protein product [Staurois parvus]
MVEIRMQTGKGHRSWMRQQAGMAVTRMQARCRTVCAAAGKYGSNQETGKVQQSQTSWVRIKRANEVQGSRQADSQR